jgi:sensor domain CHASE-containing protein
VFVPRSGYEKTFWGIVSAVVDADKLFRDSGLLDPALPIDISITGKDALGDAGERFFGDQKVVENRPVVADVLLPSGSWQIAAVPKAGWDVTPRMPGCSGRS